MLAELLTAKGDRNHHLQRREGSAGAPSRDGKGDAARQQQIMAKADATLPALIARGRAEGWRAWITYHTYYKAPDLIGGPVAQALGIPYLLVEATRAAKRLSGPWAHYAMAAERACEKAA